jgi:hypothetical protein
MICEWWIGKDMSESVVTYYLGTILGDKMDMCKMDILALHQKLNFEVRKNMSQEC